MKQQILVIHGGDTFEKYEDYVDFLKTIEIGLDDFRKKGWKKSLGENLGENYDVLLPQMPNKTNANYEEWKIWLEKILPLLNTELILIGHSLGGTFLAKYLSENEINKKIKAVILVSAVFNEENESLTNFKLPNSLDKFLSQSERIILIQSEDDKIVPFNAVKSYKNLLPKAEMMIFKDRGHFNQETFPEIIELIKRIK